VYCKKTIFPKLSTLAFDDVAVELIPSRARNPRARTMGSKSAIDTTETSEPRLKLDEAALLAYMRRVRSPPHRRASPSIATTRQEDKSDDRRQASRRAPPPAWWVLTIDRV
jgi:hypothetical protein